MNKPNELDKLKGIEAPLRLRPRKAGSRYVKGISTSHHNGKWAYKKTWPARHSKKPMLVDSMYHQFGKQ